MVSSLFCEIESIIFVKTICNNDSSGINPLNKITFQKCYSNVTLWQCDVCRYISETSMKHVGNLECPTSFTLHTGCYICDVPETFKEPCCGVRETF